MQKTVDFVKKKYMTQFYVHFQKKKILKTKNRYKKIKIWSKKQTVKFFLELLQV